MEEIKSCPVCQESNFSDEFSCIDYSISKEHFKIVTCSSCGLKFTNPRPEKNSIGKYYESTDYVSHSDTQTGIINKLYHFVRKITIRKKLDLINKLNPVQKNILDIGCGTGAFIGFAKSEGWGVTGIEPNEKVRDAAIKQYSIPVYNEQKLKELSKNSISVITMWHVLEHVHDLRERVLIINELLCGGGYLIVAVPNYTSWDAKHYKTFWAAYDVPRHLYHFSPDDIKTLFGKTGLTHVKSLPMKFDSYYVSLLSEKYKNSKLKLLNAFVNGFRSNNNAGGNAEKYSSVIYVFRKK